MKKIVQFILKQRVFFAFLIIAFTLWYISRLSHDYTSSVPLTIEFVTDNRSNVWVEEPELDVTAVVEADGRLLSFYKIGMQPNLIIETSSLIFRPTKERYVYSIDIPSLIRAIRKSDSRLSVINIEDSLITIRLSPLITRRLPIENHISVNCRRQYMIVEGLRLAFDSVDVKAPQIILDTLKSIPTEQLLFERVNSNISGKAKLLMPPNVYSTKSVVEFQAEVAGYTEIEFALPITVKNLPARISALLLPATAIVKVQVPLNKIGQSLKPVASIDYQDAQNSGRYATVVVDSLPLWAEIIYLEPKFVEPLFQPTND